MEHAANFVPARNVVMDYFINEDAEDIIHFEGDHKVHVLKATHDTLIKDKRFKPDFNTAFKTDPARPREIALAINRLQAFSLAFTATSRVSSSINHRRNCRISFARAIPIGLREPCD